MRKLRVCQAILLSTTTGCSTGSPLTRWEPASLPYMGQICFSRELVDAAVSALSGGGLQGLSTNVSEAKLCPSRGPRREKPGEFLCGTHCALSMVSRSPSEAWSVGRTRKTSPHGSGSGRDARQPRLQELYRKPVTSSDKHQQPVSTIPNGSALHCHIHAKMTMASRRTSA